MWRRRKAASLGAQDTAVKKAYCSITSIYNTSVAKGKGRKGTNGIQDCTASSLPTDLNVLLSRPRAQRRSLACRYGLAPEILQKSRSSCGPSQALDLRTYLSTAEIQMDLLLCPHQSHRNSNCSFLTYFKSHKRTCPDAPACRVAN